MSSYYFLMLIENIQGKYHLINSLRYVHITIIKAKPHEKTQSIYQLNYD